VTSPFGCFDCNGADHWSSNCPELEPVKTRKEHEARIARYVRWFRDDDPPRITAAQKRKLIETENERWRKATERKSA